MPRLLGVIWAVGCCLFLVGPVAGVSVATATEDATVSLEEHSSTPATSPAAARAADDTIRVTTALSRLPAEPGVIEVRLTYDVPSNVVSLDSTLPPDATVTDTDGFSGHGNEYEWDTRTSSPTITYRLSVNRTRTARGPLAGDGRYLFADTGEWALVRVPGASTAWEWTGGGDVSLARSTTVAGPGVAGDGIAYLGPVETTRRRAHGQTFRLVVPTRATLGPTPSEIFASVTDAADALRVGNRDETVTMFAAPTDQVGWAVNGLQVGAGDFWVRDVQQIGSAHNVWVHEYVHTRQDYEPTDGTRWFTEASASYYAALFTLEQGRIDYEAFRERLALDPDGAADRRAILSRPATWTPLTPYSKGTLVAGTLDRRIRETRDRRTLQAVLEGMNEHSRPVSKAAFERIVRTAGGPSVASLAERYTTTDAVPSVWSRRAHVRTFGTALPNVTYRFPGGDGEPWYRVDGPYRSGRLSVTGSVELAVGETLTLPVTVSNSGDAAGSYDGRLVVAGEVVGRQPGTIDAGESRVLTFRRTFDAPGTYAATIGDARVNVSVSRPAPVVVTDVQTDVSRPAGDPLVRVTATVGNDASVPAAGNVTVERAGRVVASRHVVLEPDARRTVTFDTSVPEPGTYAFTVGDLTTDVHVGAATTATPGSGRSNGDGAGFGVLAGIGALAGLGLYARRVAG